MVWKRKKESGKGKTSKQILRVRKQNEKERGKKKGNKNRNLLLRINE